MSSIPSYPYRDSITLEETSFVRFRTSCIVLTVLLLIAALALIALMYISPSAITLMIPNFSSIATIVLYCLTSLSIVSALLVMVSTNERFTVSRSDSRDLESQLRDAKKEVEARNAAFKAACGRATLYQNKADDVLKQAKISEDKASAAENKVKSLEEKVSALEAKVKALGSKKKKK